MQLRRRLESVKRIHRATDTLEDRIAELQEMQRNANGQLQALEQIQAEVEHALETTSHDQLPQPAKINLFRSF